MKFLFYCLLFFASLGLNAQNTSVFSKGKHIVIMGHGYKSWYQGGIIFYEYFYEKTFDAIGPLHFKYEYGLSEKIGVGFAIAYHKYTDINDLPVLGYRIIGKINYHFHTGKKWDPYCDVGVGPGKYKAIYSFDSSPQHDIIERLWVVEIELGLGTRYYFTKNIGLYIEAGIGKTIFQGGIAIAF